MAQESKISGGVVWILSVAAAVSFILGYLLAVVAGIFWPTNEAILAILAIMGLLVGFFNITGREIVPYLVAAIALVLIGTANPSPFQPLERVSEDLVANIDDVVDLLAVFIAPAALIQAVRAGLVLASPGD